MQTQFKFRVFENKEPQLPTPFNCSKDVYDLAYNWINADREVFVIFFLNSKNQIIEYELHTIGDVDSSAVYPRQLFRSALAHNCASLIVAHNHPSGDYKPSIGDDKITKELVAGGRLLGIKVLDHVIIGKEGYYSYGDKGKIEEYELESR